MNKYIIKTLSALIIISSLTSCSNNTIVPAMSTDIDTSETASQLNISEIAASIENVMSNSSKLTAVEDDYITGMLELDMADIDEYILKVQTSGTEADQYGIFRAVDDNAAQNLADAVEKYLDTLKASWDNFDYLPEEGQKIKNAKVIRNGDYVLYVIASDTEMSAVTEVFNSQF